MQSVTMLDEETFSILLYHLYPWINNYNNVVQFLFKCNMDIKFIGLGEVAKALIYYVTNYITKASFSTYLSLQVLYYVIKSNNAKFSSAPSNMNITMVCRSLMIKIVNLMMAQLKMSHQ